MGFPFSEILLLENHTKALTIVDIFSCIHNIANRFQSYKNHDRVANHNRVANYQLTEVIVSTEKLNPITSINQVGYLFSMSFALFVHQRHFHP